MADREKVIKGLNSCSGSDPCVNSCPYYDNCGNNYSCTSNLAKDALALLKEREKKRFFVDSDGKITPLPDIVLCKDCKKHDTYDCHITYLTTQKTPNDWFCADGERR